jgi:hypothetical protein
MLTIRGEQLEIFKRQMDRCLLEKTLDFLRQESPEQIAGLPEYILWSRVREALRRAEEYGIESDVSTQTFVAMMFDFGPHFDAHPVVAALLGDTTLPADDRLDILVFEGSDRVWEEMAILSGGDWWDDEPAAPSRQEL